MNLQLTTGVSFRYLPSHSGLNLDSLSNGSIYYTLDMASVRYDTMCFAKSREMTISILNILVYS